MSATSLGMRSAEVHPAINNDEPTNIPKKTAVVTPQLEKLMRQICDLVDNHPEWMHQSQPERMKNFLSAVREL